MDNSLRDSESASFYEFLDDVPDEYKKPLISLWDIRLGKLDKTALVDEIASTLPPYYFIRGVVTVSTSGSFFSSINQKNTYHCCPKFSARSPMKCLLIMDAKLQLSQDGLRV